MDQIYNNIIKKYNIKQILISKSLKNNISYPYDKLYYKSLYNSTLFIGVYSENDIIKISNHIGDIYILWYGNDCNPKYKNRINNVIKISKLYIKKHFCISNRVNEYLKTFSVISYEFICRNINDIQKNIIIKPQKNIIIKPFFEKIKIGIFTTQLPYDGGASTLAFDIYKYFIKNNLDTKICFFIKKKKLQSIKEIDKKDTILSDENVYILPNREKLIKKYSNITDELSHFNLVIAINYGVVSLIKKFYNNNILYLIVGSPELTLGNNSPVSNSISYNNFINSNSDINDLEDNINVKMNKESLNSSHIIIANSLHTKKLYDKIYKDYSLKIFYIGSIECEIYKNKYYLNDNINYNTDYYKNRKYDLICISSNWNRIVKNINLVYNIYKNLPTLNKVIIGLQNKNYNFTKIPNTLVLGNLKNEIVHKFLSESKILIMTSFFESASISILEAIINGCKVLTSTNVAMSSILQNDCICKDIYDIMEWLSKIYYLNKNNNITYNYPSKTNFLKLIHKIQQNYINEINDISISDIFELEDLL